MFRAIIYMVASMRFEPKNSGDSHCTSRLYSRNWRQNSTPGTVKSPDEICLTVSALIWARRLFGVIFAIGVAIGAGLLFLPLVAFVDPVTRSSGFALMELTVAAIVDAEVVDGLDSSSLTELTGFM